jgi:hypothetical protein
MSESTKGWVSLSREITDHWVWNCEFSTGQAWVDLIIHACHSPNKFMLKGQLVALKRGQQARSEVTLAKAWKWSRNKVRRFLKNLENDGMIVQKTTHLTSVITICNYDSFQSGGTVVGTAKRHLTEHVEDSRRNTNNNVNNINNEKNTAIGKIPIQQQQQQILDLFNDKFHMLPRVEILTEKRKALIAKFMSSRQVEKSGYALDELGGYFDYIITNCTWMLRDGVSGEGKRYKPKDFNYFIHDDCYAAVKEQRYNDGGI